MVFSIAPLDSPDPGSLAGFESIVDRFDIPGAFVDERSQGVMSSFGHLPEGPTSFC